MHSSSATFTSSAKAALVGKANDVMKHYFGYSSLKSFQGECLDAFLDGRDIMVIMATGGGKSTCFQLPPLVVDKTAIVISPLISLMQNQVTALRKMNINAVVWGPTSTMGEIQDILAGTVPHAI